MGGALHCRAQGGDARGRGPADVLPLVRRNVAAARHWSGEVQGRHPVDQDGEGARGGPCWIV